MGQEVRVHVSSLDNTSRLPFIRGVLNKDDYLRGCKLPQPQESQQNKRLSICEYNDDYKVPSSAESSKRGKAQTFFTSDSEGSLEEDAEPSTKRKQVKKQQPLTNNDSHHIPDEEELNDMLIDNDNDHENSTIYATVSAQKLKSKSPKKTIKSVADVAAKKLIKERVRTISGCKDLLDEATHMRRDRNEKPSIVQQLSDNNDTEAHIFSPKTHSKNQSIKAGKNTKMSKTQSEDVDITDDILAGTDENIGHKMKRKKKKRNETNKEIAGIQLSISEEELVTLSHSVDNHDISRQEDIDQVPKKKKSKKHTKVDGNNASNTLRSEEGMEIESVDSTEDPVLNFKTDRLETYDSTLEKKSKTKKSKKHKKAEQDDDDSNTLKNKERRNVDPVSSIKMDESTEIPVLSVKTERLGSYESTVEKKSKLKKSKKYTKVEQDINVSNSLINEMGVKTEVEDSTLMDASTEIPVWNLKTERLGSYDSGAEKKIKSKKSKKHKKVELDNRVSNTSRSEEDAMAEAMDSTTIDESTETPKLNFKTERLGSYNSTLEKRTKKSKKHKSVEQNNDISNTSRSEEDVKAEAMDSTTIDESTEIPELNFKTERPGSYDSTLEKRTKKNKRHRSVEQNNDISNTSRNEMGLKEAVMDSSVLDSRSEIPILNVKTERLGSYDSTTEKKSKLKKSPEPTTITSAGIMKIKRERSVSVSGSEKAIENEKSPRKAEKRPKCTYGIVLENSMQSPDKRSPKKIRISEGETEDTSLPIKPEMCAMNSVTKSENSDASQTNPQSSPTKKKSKKLKPVKDDTEADDNVYERTSKQLEFANSSGFNLSSEIPMMDIKHEEVESGDGIDQNEYSAIFQTALISPETSSKKKKKKKSKDKDILDNEIFDGSFNVMVKTEEPDSDSVTVKQEIKISPKKKARKERNQTILTEEDVDLESTERYSRNLDAGDATVLCNKSIKVEESSDENTKKKKLHKKSRGCSESTNSFEYCNIKIKVEKDS